MDRVGTHYGLGGTYGAQYYRLDSMLQTDGSEGAFKTENRKKYFTPLVISSVDDIFYQSP